MAIATSASTVEGGRPAWEKYSEYDEAAHWVAARGEFDALEDFLRGRSGAPTVDPNNKDRSGRNLLHRVAGWGHPISFISLLKDNEVDIDATDELGWSALHFSAANGYSHVVSYLLKSRASASTADISGRQAIWYAAQNGHSDVVKALCNAPGIDLNAADCQGRTPLHAAAAALAIEAPVAKNSARPPVNEEAQAECVRILLAAGAVKQADLEGKQPAQIAYSAAIKALL
jgi:ankyrin repeat protein